MSNSKHHSVLITGVAGEIGAATAKLYKNKGYDVIGVDNKEVSTKYIDKFIQQDISELLTSDNAKNKFNESLLAVTNVCPLKVLVNNAALQIVKPAIDCEYADQLATFQVNLFVPHLLSQLCYEELQKNEGTIINVASVHASATKKEFSLYAASKAALISLTRSLALELGPKIRVNSVSPAAIETEMLKDGFKGNKQLISKLGDCHISKRIGKPEEVAELIYFLSSDKCRFITGCDYRIDGGVLSKLLDPDNQV